MNDETKRSRMRAGVIGASVAVAAIGAMAVVATNKDSDEEERVSSVVSKRDALGPVRGEPVVDVTPPGPKWEREPRNVRDTTKDDPQLARQQAIEQARNAGILGKAALQGGAFASLTGTGDFSSGIDDKNIYGGLLGNDADLTGYGYGRSGFGPGGGGTGWGTIGTGRYGTIGRGSGTGAGYGVGGGRGGIRRDAPVATLAQPNVVAVQGDGSLDKANVRRYLKRNLAKLTYCYEKELVVKPTLAGTIQIQFEILDTGITSGVNASGVDPTVASCVASVIGGIEFPKPKGSGGVQVNVPLTVRPK
jgi:hypothetical protein